jgi:hypothetical protein
MRSTISRSRFEMTGVDAARPQAHTFKAVTFQFRLKEGVATMIAAEGAETLSAP